MMFKKKDMPDLPRTCEFCESAANIRDDTHVLCKRNGAVNREYSCRRFVYDPLKRVPHTLPAIPVLTEDDILD